MSSSDSYYYSSSTQSSTEDGNTSTSGQRYSASSHTDPEGITTIRTSQQDLGSPPIIEEHKYDSSGYELPSGSLAGGVRTITEDDDDEHVSNHTRSHHRSTQTDEPSYSRYHPIGRSAPTSEDVEASEFI